MFKIYDGREAFYQWDLDRKLIVNDNSINEVHFCNRTDECSLVCAVYDEDGLRLVDVPNILLQQDWRINVYGYDKNYTKHSVIFDVHRRSRPEDYVYTENQIKTWDELEERVEALEENGVDLSNYYTKEEVDNTLSGVEVDLSDYYTKEETNALIPDTSGFTTMAAVEEKGYQTEAQVLALIEAHGGSGDLPASEEGAF